MEITGKRSSRKSTENSEQRSVKISDHQPKKLKRDEDSEVDDECKFVRESLIYDDDARKHWPHRYCSNLEFERKSASTADFLCHEILQAKYHFTEALVDGNIIKLYDDVYIKAEDGEPNYIAKIVEFFETSGKEQYITAQWFFRTEDTVIRKEVIIDENLPVDNRCVFLSELKEDNPLGSIDSLVRIAHITSNMCEDEKNGLKDSHELYCDMNYLTPFYTFKNLDFAPLYDVSKSDTSSASLTDVVSELDNDIPGCSSSTSESVSSKAAQSQKEMSLLDLFSGCGAMSTGLCLGAALSGSTLVTKWAVDLNTHACESLQKNHPETKVRNETAEEYLSLLKEWKKLCDTLLPSVETIPEGANAQSDEDGDEDEEELEDGVFEVEELLDIRFDKKQGLLFKVRWKGYGPDEDLWEPYDNLMMGSEERVKEFVVKGYHSELLPLPGTVDVLCGGPPCQGISGNNRYRTPNEPFTDKKNKQLKVFMDTVEFLRPRYTLMENVIDITKFAEGVCARYTIGRLVGMNYQTRIGIMAAGSYGVPQVRYRALFWGAQMSEELPSYPLPTHKLLGKGCLPVEFKNAVVRPDQNGQLEEGLVLGVALSDLPPVDNDETRDEQPYGQDPMTDFQRYIRLRRNEIFGLNDSQEVVPCATLYDHRTYNANEDDFQRICLIPMEKGANFRCLPGVIVDSKNRAMLDPKVERAIFDSGNYVVPDYAIKYKGGKSPKPFRRLWPDEIVTTVVTRPEPHNQAILHWNQNRVLTVREIARLQGFPDCYQLFGPAKERYAQVGNAVAVPVGIALGYVLGMASKGLVDGKPVVKLPFKFPDCLAKN